MASYVSDDVALADMSGDNVILSRRSFSVHGWRVQVVHRRMQEMPEILEARDSACKVG